MTSYKQCSPIASIQEIHSVQNSFSSETKINITNAY